ncbi:MAG: hypothetical protein OQK67_08545 [Chlorobium sp.]|nr:hypothetical protein [Chlorobium sp.]MCW8814681.1 hypothetical protein [Chlorobium sp.]MCW8820201.1 hypothetical protein [Ignavibacteriaceae bacterium]
MSEEKKITIEIKVPAEMGELGEKEKMDVLAELQGSRIRDIFLDKSVGAKGMKGKVEMDIEWHKS